jgi:hypothetical protein
VNLTPFVMLWLVGCKLCFETNGCLVHTPQALPRIEYRKVEMLVLQMIMHIRCTKFA